MKHLLLSHIPLVLVLSAAGCSGEAEVFESTNAELTAAVGTPCVLPTESDPSFGSLSTGETIVEQSDACGYGQCVAWKFQGRASCPEGGEPGECRTPEGEPVTVAVEPQLPERPADEAMVCSCRCSGDETYGPLCACPNGFDCRTLIEDLGLGAAEYVGGYCVKE